VRVSAAKETKKRIRDSDVIEAVRLVLAVASEKLSFPADREIVVNVWLVRTRIGLVRQTKTSNVFTAFINPKGTRAEWAEEALRTLLGTYAMREVIRARVEAKGIQTRWPSRAPRVVREATKVEKLAEVESRIAEWESKLKDATRAQRLARTKLKGYRASARRLRSEVAKQPTTEMNALDFSEVMRMKRERGEMREVLA
jgi:hypothetical protein